MLYKKWKKWCFSEENMLFLYPKMQTKFLQTPSIPIVSFYDSVRYPLPPRVSSIFLNGPRYDFRFVITLGLLGSVKTILPAGAAIPLESERKLRENFPELRSVSSLYGTSEIGIIARTDTNKHIGYLMPLVEVKVCLSKILR